jgi:hypothetical protein
MNYFSPFELINTTVAVVSALASIVIAFASYMLLRSTRDKTEVHYNEMKKQAELSEMRAFFERQISELSTKLTATESRWRDANHLLLSSQKAQTDDFGSTRPPFTNYLKTMGVTQDDLNVDPLLVFVLTPFGEEYRESYDAIVKVCHDIGLKCVRGDEENASGEILTHILRLMLKARLVIANVGGRNPNVYYELGLAHALDKSTILVSQELEGVAFDIRSQRILIFDSISSLSSRLLPMIARILRRPG